MRTIDRLLASAIVICFYGSCAAGVVWGSKGFLYTIVSCFLLVGCFIVLQIWV